MQGEIDASRPVDTKVGFLPMDIHRDWFDSHKVSDASVDIELGKPHLPPRVATIARTDGSRNA